jgi:hypothetical protein
MSPGFPALESTISRLEVYFAFEIVSANGTPFCYLLASLRKSSGPFSSNLLKRINPDA